MIYRAVPRVRQALFVLFALLAALVAPCGAYAATPNVLPGNADPGRIMDNLNPIAEPSFATPKTEAPAIAINPAPIGSEKVYFTLNGIRIEGATAYSTAELEKIYAPYIGMRIPLSKLYEFTGAITQRYHDDGYALSWAILPPQTLSDGHVTIRVVEGYINQVTTQGSYRDSYVTRGLIQRISSYRPLNMKDLERDVLLLNDLAGVSVHAVLNPPQGAGHNADTIGGSDLTLVFDDVPYGTNISVDNRGSRYVGPYELGASTGIYHLLTPYQQTEISTLVSLPTKELKYISATTAVPISDYGTLFSLQGSYAHTMPGFRLQSLDLESDAFNYGAAVSQSLIRSRSTNLSALIDITIKDILTDVLQTRLYDDRLRIAGFGLNYNLSDDLGGANVAQAKITHGLNWLGATKTGTLNLSRADGHSDFTKFTANAGRLQVITDNTRLYIAATGQQSNAPLLSSEQFGFGGTQFGRAYDASELTGDNGAAALAELRYIFPVPEIPQLSCEMFTFYDIGLLWDDNDYQDRKSAASAGFGFRFNYTQNLYGSLTIADPLTHDVATAGQNKGDLPRIFFAIGAKF